MKILNLINQIKFLDFIKNIDYEDFVLCKYDNYVNQKYFFKYTDIFKENKNIFLMYYGYRKRDIARYFIGEDKNMYVALISNKSMKNLIKEKGILVNE